MLIQPNLHHPRFHWLTGKERKDPKDHYAVNVIADLKLRAVHCSYTGRQGWQICYSLDFVELATVRIVLLKENSGEISLHPECECSSALSFYF